MDSFSQMNLPLRKKLKCTLFYHLHFLKFYNFFLNLQGSAPPPSPTPNKEMKNKAVLCKPLTMTKATFCKPHMQTKSCQTGIYIMEGTVLMYGVLSEYTIMVGTLYGMHVVVASNITNCLSL